MDRDQWWAPLVGAAFVLLVITGFAVGGEPPGAEDGAQKVASFYLENDTKLMVSGALIGVAATMLVFFAGVLRRELRKAEGEGGTLSLIAFAGALILAVGAAIDAMLLFVMAEAADKIAPAQLQTIQAIWDNDFLPMAVGVQVFMLAAGLSIVRHGALAKWLGWMAIVIGVIAITPAGFVSFMAGGIWILIVSGTLALRGRPAAARPAAAPPAASPGL